MQIEQSIHQAIQKQVPKVITSKDTTIEELEEFDKMAQEYEETMKESLILKDKADVDSLEELGSGIKWSAEYWHRIRIMVVSREAQRWEEEVLFCTIIKEV